MTTIKIEDLPVETAIPLGATHEESDAVKGGATVKATAKPKQQYLTYELENVLISSYQTS